MDKVTNEQKISEILTFLDKVDPNFTLVSTISLKISKNFANLENYTMNMNSELIQKYLKDFAITDENQQFGIELLFALMYKDLEMQNFVFDILQSNTDISEKDFIKLVNDTNNKVTNQSGGVNFKNLLQDLGLIGIIIFTAYYDNFIITSGSWDRFGNALNTGMEISSRIREGCRQPYRPSKTTKLLSRFTADPTLIENLEYTAQCLANPTTLTNELEKIEEEEIQRQLLSTMKNSFKELPGLPKLLELQAPSETGTELVIFGQRDPKQITTYLEEKLIVYDNNEIDSEKSIARLKLLGDMSIDEFKRVIEDSAASPSTMPSVMPSAAPSYQQISSFVSDLTGAIREMAPSSLSTSVSIENSFLWALQDIIRENTRKMENDITNAKRNIEDFIREASRIYSDIKTIPWLLSFLFTINLAAFRAILYFAKKFKSGPKPVKLVIEPAIFEEIEEIKGNEEIKGIEGNEGNEGDEEIKEIKEIEEIKEIKETEGGRRRKRKTNRKQKRKTHKHTKKCKKICKTRAKKRRRRITRRY